MVGVSERIRPATRRSGGPSDRAADAFAREKVPTVPDARDAEEAAPGRAENGVQVISRVTAILRAVAHSPGGVGVAELGRLVGLPRSTVYRIVATLAEDGFVTMPGGRSGVRLGPELAQLALAARQGLVEAAQPCLESTAKQVNETVDLAVLQQGQVRFIGQAVGNQRLRAEVVVGETFPAYCTANGKALLAQLAPSALDAVLAATPLVRLTPHTIVGREALLAELGQVRASGVAFDREEHTLQICAVGAAIDDPKGGLAAAVTIATPAHRFYGREDELREALLGVKADIEAAVAAF
jgi:DNA-binding IclR family transcriptional regulator